VSTPLITTIIPTFRRPALLSTAVQSALDYSGPDAEVIVAPNGPDESWKPVLARFSADPRVRACPIAAPGANAARNRALSAARGQYVRFLDDDDYLLPDAQWQVHALEASGAEVCSGSVEKVDEAGSILGVMDQQDDHDFVCATIRPNRVCLPLAHVFLRSAIVGRRWNEALANEQDTEWMFRHCAIREWKWISSRDKVGRWRHHRGTRTSDSIGDQDRARFTTQLLLELRDHLADRDMLLEARSKAIALALWDFAHSHFYSDPTYWRSIAIAALKLDPVSRPPDRFYSTRFGRTLNPLLVESVLSPLRIARRWRERQK
jgi:glycosyltransferase involved in cell wall biosynthesis